MSILPASTMHATDQFLLVHYRDNNRRNNSVPVNDLILHAGGPIHNNWTHQSANVRYGDFGGVAGSTGSFTFEFRNGNSARIVDGTRFITTEFAAPANPSAFADLPARYVRLETMVNDLGVNLNTLSVTFAHIGTYRVRIHSGISTQQFMNEYIITVRNGIFDDDFTIDVFVGTTATNSISMFNSGIPSDIVVNAMVNGRADISTGPIFWNIASIRLLQGEAGPDAENLFSTHMSPPVAAPGRNDRLTFTTRHEAIFENHIPYTLHMQIRIVLPNITPTGHAVPEDQIITVSRPVVITFRPVPTPGARSPFPWMGLLISILVMGALGAGWWGSNWLIRNSQYTHEARRLSNRRGIDTPTNRNIDDLREQIQSEVNEARENELVADLYSAVDGTVADMGREMYDRITKMHEQGRQTFDEPPSDPAPRKKPSSKKD